MITEQTGFRPYCRVKFRFSVGGKSFGKFGIWIPTRLEKAATAREKGCDSE
jgi:hypothetical protein